MMSRRWIPVVLAAAICSQTAIAQVQDITSATQQETVGIALDAANSILYYVEETSGALKRVDIKPPGCAPCPAPVKLIPNSSTAAFVKPRDVFVDTDHQIAWVVDQTKTSTTPGTLWRVDLAKNDRAIAAFGLATPQQVVVDTSGDSAYIAGFDDGSGKGRLWKVKLSTGAKKVVIGGLDGPVGLAVTKDRTRAFITEKSGKIVEIEIATGTRVRDLVTGLAVPGHLTWTDASETALFVADGLGVSEVVRVDLPTATKVPVLTNGLPAFSPARAVAVSDYDFGYASASNKIVRFPLAQLPPSQPVFISVGHVPVTSIDAAGYAQTSQFKDSPFGGSLKIFGNLSNFKNLTATQYRVMMKPLAAAGTHQPLKQTWSVSEWDPTLGKLKEVQIAPVDPDGWYEISPLYPVNAGWRIPQFLVMRWPSGAFGLYDFRIELRKPGGTPGTWLPVTPPPHKLTILVDNESPVVDLVNIHQQGAGIVQACSIVSTGVPAFRAEVTAFDSRGHMLSYGVTALWGKNKSGPVVSEQSTAVKWNGVTNKQGPPNGWTATCNCAHTFMLTAWKRTIDGYNYQISRQSHQSITINNTGNTTPCP